MGRFFNSKVNAFQDVLNSKIYIDKTGLLEYTNSVIDTTSKFICNSRPRRFGKSITADMMTAYYSRSLDTEEMFEKLNIGQAVNIVLYIIFDFIMAVIMFMSLPFIVGIMVDIRHQGIGCFAAWVIWGVMFILLLRLFNALKLRCQKKPEKR